jgi:DNA (cytosine-5)-methyltransferase 1
MINVGSDFSGVGAFNQALIRLGIEYKEIFACDMDKYARQTFIHNYGEPEYYPTNVYDREIPSKSIDIYMTSPPCQAFSLAGKRLGKDDKRGILFFNSHEFIQVNKPRYFIFENVKGLLSDDGGKTFSEWVNMLGGKSVNGVPVIFPYEDSVPYHLYWKVLNAKHHGVPQNRERVFLIGIRDDQDNTFRFPIEEHLNKRLKDVLEHDVSDKYFLSEKLMTWIKGHREKRDSSNKYPLDENDISGCMTARYGKNGAEDPYIKINKLGFINQDTQASAVYDSNGLSQTMTAGTHGYAMGYIQIKSATSKGYEEATEGDSINFSVPNSETRRGRVGKGVAQTLDTGCQQGVLHKYQKEIEQSINQDICTGIDASYYKGFGVRQGKCRQVVKNDYKIRRLTPRECFRLMDFPDTFTWPVSDSQAYKQAGNSIVVNVLYKILKNLNL